VSKPVPIFTGSIDATGKLWMEARGLFDRYLTTLKNKPVHIVVKAATRRKSQSQLGYLWGVVYPVIAEDLGYCDYEHEAMHDAIIRHLRGLKPEPNPLGIRVSLSEMTHEEVSGYISDVRHWALTEHGIVTPDAHRVEFVDRGRTSAA
jgi:hypothetical protein